MNLTTEELQYILNAIDTHVRQHGLNAAAIGIAISEKIQEAAKVQKPPGDAGEGGED